MTFASSSARTIRARSVPLATASALSVSIYAVYTTWKNPLLAEDLSGESSSSTAKKTSATPKFALPATTSPYVPLGWGSNRNLTLVADAALGNVKRPTPLGFIGATPLRDLVLAERYGACIDARGDCWMWGTGYDPSGDVGRALKGKKLKELAPSPAKLVALSKDGRLYAFSSSKSVQAQRNDKKEQSWWTYLFGSDAGIDFLELKAQGGMRSGEKWAGISAGTHHLLAVTTKGRAFSLPLSAQANTHRQLGTRQELSPTLREVPADSDPRYWPTLTEIPSLSGIEVAQVATSDRSSFVRTPTGRVLGFGANEVGQIGLGSNAAVETIQVPVEVVLAKGYPGGTAVSCIDIKAGGTTTFFTVERSATGKQGTFVDLLACGSGINGALGNGLWSSANGSPSRVKTVSGLQEYSEKANAFLPLGISSLSVASSPSAHVFAVLDSAKEADEKGLREGLYGKDVMVWGGNADYQLGNGKRSSLAVPQHLPALVERFAGATGSKLGESGWSSGTLSPMPHSRLQLHQGKANAYDLTGKLIKRNVRCEETIVAGYNASALYNKIID